MTYAPDPNRPKLASQARKLCVLGEFAVGKSSLVKRYVHNSFSPTYRATLGVNISKFTDRISLGGSQNEAQSDNGDAQPVSLILWDVEGGGEKDARFAGYLHGASGALVVGDMTRPETVDAMAGYAEFFSGRSPGRPLAFALNKLDLVDSAEARRVAGALAERHGGRLIVTSAATGEAVATLFRALARRILTIGA